jgi:hypothetical protein
MEESLGSEMDRFRARNEPEVSSVGSAPTTEPPGERSPLDWREMGKERPKVCDQLPSLGVSSLPDAGSGLRLRRRKEESLGSDMDRLRVRNEPRTVGVSSSVEDAPEPSATAAR